MIEKSIFKDGANKNLTHPKTQKGITLIALVITIIVLLILAGVTISMVLGDDGIIQNAQQAKNKNESATVKELADLADTNYKLDSELGNTDKSKKEYIEEKLSSLGATQEQIDSIVIDDKGNIIQMCSASSDEVKEFIANMDSSLIYNAGYLTGLVDMDNEAMYTKQTLLAKLPEGSDILDYYGGDIAADKTISTGFRIVNEEGKIIAFTIFFGDVDGSGYINAYDMAVTDNVSTKPLSDRVKGKFESLEYVSFDVNNDGVVSESDKDVILGAMQAVLFPPYIGYIDQFRPATPNIEIIVSEAE